MFRYIKATEDLTNRYFVGQKVLWIADEGYLGYNEYEGTVTQVAPDHVLVDVPAVSDHCYFESDMVDELLVEGEF